MSIWGAFTNSVQAMQTQSHSLGVISQNIANVNTGGYKTAEDLFKTNLSEVTAQTNIFGVKPITRQLIDVQGPITNSNNWNDLAINGSGFFVTNSALDGSGNTTFTRAGSFSPTNVAPDGTVSSQTYFSDGSGNYLMGYANSLGPSGVGSATSSTKGLTAISYQLGATMAAKATSQISVQGTVPANAASAQGVGLPLYDNSGNSQTLTMNWSQTSANTWSLSYSVDPKEGSVSSTPVTVTFDGNGKIQSPTSTTANIAWADGTSSNVGVDLSKLQQLASSTFQMGEVTQDGYTSGNLNQFAFDGQGVLTGTYTNGQTQTLGQIAMAQFRNPDALQTLSGTTFAQTADAGTMQIGTVGSFPGQTQIVPNAVEQSNVKLEDQFSQMIITQKAYSSAAEVFKTADEMTQGARDLKT